MLQVNSVNYFERLRLVRLAFRAAFTFARFFRLPFLIDDGFFLTEIPYGSGLNSPGNQELFPPTVAMLVSAATKALLKRERDIFCLLYPCRLSISCW